MIAEMIAISNRELKHWYRARTAVFMSLIQPLIWLGLFGNALGNAPMPFLSVLGAPNYLSFMTPGIVAMTMLFGGTFAGMSVIWDKRFGYLNKLLVAPIPRTPIVLGKMISATIRGMIQGLIVLTIAIALGVAVQTGILGIVLTMLITGLFTLGLASISIAAATSMKTHETFFAFINLINLPLMFMSNALFPTAFMPNWMKSVASVNPFSFCVEAVRMLIIGNLDLSRLLFDLEALLVFTLAATSIGIVTFRRITK